MLSTEEKKKREATKFINNVNKKMKSKFEECKGIPYNPNTKGGDYEKIISTLLSEYLGSKFEFYNRAQIIDVNMDYLQVFSTGGNEFDIVATFANTLPKIVVKAGDTNFVPYDAAAFLVEVKAQMNKETLKADLNKLQKVDCLTLTPNRLGGISLGSKYKIERPLKVLLYFNASIDDNVRENLLQNFYNIWDVVLIIQKNEILLNRCLPIVDKIMSDRSMNGCTLSWG